MLCLRTDHQTSLGGASTPPSARHHSSGARPPPQSPFPAKGRVLGLTEDPTQPHPTLLLEGLWVPFPPQWVGVWLPSPLQHLHGPSRESPRPSSPGGGLSSKLWGPRKGLLGHSHSGPHLAEAVLPLLPSSGTSVWAVDEPAFRGRACQEGGSAAPRQP